MTIYHIAEDYSLRYSLDGENRMFLRNVLCGANNIPLCKGWGTDEPSYYILEFMERTPDDYQHICEGCRNSPEFGLWLLAGQE